jgi:hypothetical protein
VGTTSLWLEIQALAARLVARMSSVYGDFQVVDADAVAALLAGLHTTQVHASHGARGAASFMWPFSDFSNDQFFLLRQNIYFRNSLNRKSRLRSFSKLQRAKK